MLKIIYIEDYRRPERNLEYKDTIRKLGLESVIEYCECVEVDHISNLEADGVICHSGMAGYDVVKHFAQKKERKTQRTAVISLISGEFECGFG